MVFLAVVGDSETCIRMLQQHLGYPIVVLSLDKWTTDRSQIAFGQSIPGMTDYLIKQLGLEKVLDLYKKHCYDVYRHYAMLGADCVFIVQIDEAHAQAFKDKLDAYLIKIGPKKLFQRNKIFDWLINSDKPRFLEDNVIAIANHLKGD